MKEYEDKLTEELISVAEYCDDPKVIKKIIEKGAKVNPDVESVISKFTRTPLMAAAIGGNAKVGKFLIEECGADVNAVSAHCDAFTALFYAAQYGNLDIFKVLIENGADVNYKPGEECIKRTTLLTNAAMGGNPEIIKILVEYGLNINECDAQGYSPLALALWAQSVKGAKILIDNGADINGRYVFHGNIVEELVHLSKADGLMDDEKELVSEMINSLKEKATTKEERSK